MELVRVAVALVQVQGALGNVIRELVAGGQVLGNDGRFRLVLLARCGVARGGGSRLGGSSRRGSAGGEADGDSSIVECTSIEPGRQQMSVEDERKTTDTAAYMAALLAAEDEANVTLASVPEAASWTWSMVPQKEKKSSSACLVVPRARLLTATVELADMARVDSNDGRRDELRAVRWPMRERVNPAPLAGGQGSARWMQVCDREALPRGRCPHKSSTCGAPPKQGAGPVFGSSLM